MVTFVDRAVMTTSTVGTGVITLGAALGKYQTFTQAGVADGDTVRYVIEDGAAWEIGLGVYTAAGATMTRSMSRSSTGAVLVLTGTAQVFLTPTAEDLSRITAIDRTQQGLSAFNIPMTYTPVDVAIDRMADWSDGGFNMRVQQSSKSWYNEVTTATGTWLNEAANEAAARLLSGAGTGAYYHNTADGKFYSLNATSGQTEVFRGNKAGFPEEYVVVAEADRVVVFDATDPSLPMWMVFSVNVSINMVGILITSCGLADGKLLVGSSNWAVQVVDLVADYRDLYWTGSIYRYNGTVAERNSGKNHTPRTGNGIVNIAVNDVAITVLPDAPIDQTTGMPVPTIRVGTAGGISVIQNDGTVTSFASSIFTAVGSNSPEFDLWYRGSATNAFGLAKLAGMDIYAYMNSSWHLKLLDASGSIVETWVVTGQKNGQPAMGELSQIKFDPSSAKNHMVNYLTTTYLSGWMLGDIRGAWLADTTAETITGAELVTNGTFTTDVSGWYVAFSGARGAITWVSGAVRVDNSISPYNAAMQGIPTVTGKTYTLTAEVVTRSGTSGEILGVTNSSNGASAYATAAVTGTGIVSVTFEATASTTYTILGAGTGSTASYIDWDNVSCRLADPDRSVKNNGLQVFGSLTKAPVATGADLMAYSGFSASNYLQQPYNPDLDFGTGDFCVMGWVNMNTGGAAYPGMFSRTPVLEADPKAFNIKMDEINHKIYLYAGVATRVTSTVIPFGAWVFWAVKRDQDGYWRLFINGLINSTSAATDVTDYSSPSATTYVGVATNTGWAGLHGSLAILRIGATAPSADQIKHIYETEKVLFQDNAKCTLYGTSDAVTDMAYDEITGSLNVLTSSGLSRFNGLRRVSEQAGTFTQVASHAGTEILI